MVTHLPIGKIVKSNSHIDYVCQVFGQGETLHPPAPSAYGFGSFVAVELETPGASGRALVGLVYNTLLMNPEFGALGPRLSPRSMSHRTAAGRLATVMLRCLALQPRCSVRAKSAPQAWAWA